MAYNFDSGQFNRESTPKRLGNWEVPRWAPTRARPEEMRPNPKPICDTNGHFYPGAPRGKSKCFGHYTGTWDLPRKITRQVAEELAKEPPPGRFPDWLNLRVQRPKAVAPRLRGSKRGKDKKDEKAKADSQDAQTFKEADVSENLGNNNNTDGDGNSKFENNIDLDNRAEQENNKDNDPLELLVKKEPVDADGNGPYIPGSLTDPEKRHDSHDILVNQAIEELHGPQEPLSDKFWRKVSENAKENELLKQNMKEEKSSTTPKLPHVNVSQNFHFAKKMHVGNLEHQPLPDTLGYRNLTKIAEHRDSDIIVKPYAIGWKGFGASGPTCCTKMRVHRPKTCDAKKLEADKDAHNHRPSTSGPDLGGQYKKPMSLMDLAICWDFRPDDPKREPRPPKHIDGSNGSKAPAVFTMVHTPKEEIENSDGHANPIFNQNRLVGDMGHHPVPYFEKDMTKEKRKDLCDVQYCPQHTADMKGSRSLSTSRKSSVQSVKKPECDGIHGCGTPPESRKSSRGDIRPEKLQPIKEAWNTKDKTKNAYDVNRNRHSLESYEKTPLAQGKLHHSSPNDSRQSNKDSDSLNVKHKNCLSCNGTKLIPDTKLKEDYKFAFKAGNPNSVQSVSGSTDSKGVKMPKMRHPYSKKSYTIPTLAPPFSIWRDANATGYPEHWRLASVYQHSYKPPEQRRKTLMNSVYQ